MCGDNYMGLTTDEAFTMLFGGKNFISQKRANMTCVFAFSDIDDAKLKLHQLSHDPDTTLVYYNTVILTSSEFTKKYGGYVYVPDNDEPNDSCKLSYEEGQHGCCKE